MTFPCDDIYDAKECARAIHSRSGAWNEFDPINEVDIDGEVGTDTCLIVEIVIEPNTVDQKQDPGVVIPGRRKTTSSEVVVRTVIGDIQAAHATEDISQCPIAEQADVIRSHHTHSRRCLQDRLLVATCGSDVQLH